MASEFETVDVWIGDFSSAERLTEYLRESIDPDDDDAPISEFAQDMDEPYYDHDFVEAKFHGARLPVEGLLQNHSYSKSYAEEVVKAAAGMGITSGNTVVLVWGERITMPLSAVADEYTLNYVGRFGCDPTVGR